MKQTSMCQTLRSFIITLLCFSCMLSHFSDHKHVTQKLCEVVSLILIGVFSMRRRETVVPHHRDPKPPPRRERSETPNGQLSKITGKAFILSLGWCLVLQIIVDCFEVLRYPLLIFMLSPSYNGRKSNLTVPQNHALEPEIFTDYIFFFCIN